jgi:thioredoxin-like negative regulator of GroEL
MLESAEQLDALLGQGKPVLLTFTGPKCMVCRQLAPMLAAVAGEAGEALLSAKADVELLAGLAERYAVQSLPTTLLFRDGALADRMTGFATAGALRRWLARHAVPLASSH